MNVIKIQDEYSDYKYQLDRYITNFENEGKLYGNQDRNSLKLFDLNGKTINVKSFKIPNIFNQIAFLIIKFNHLFYIIISF